MLFDRGEMKFSCNFRNYLCNCICTFPIFKMLYKYLKEAKMIYRFLFYKCINFVFVFKSHLLFGPSKWDFILKRARKFVNFVYYTTL